jgi:hypothetical protein
VLGSDVVVLQRASFVLRKDDYLASPLSEALKQPSNPLSATIPLGGRTCRPQIEGRPIVAQRSAPTSNVVRRTKTLYEVVTASS